MAAFAAAFLAAALAAPAFAAEGPTRLVEPKVSPRVGTPATPVTFAVTYRNTDGVAPRYVRVLIDGRARAMEPAGGSADWSDRVRYSLTVTLPAGTHPIVFVAADLRASLAVRPAGRVTIRAGNGDGDGSSGGGSQGGGGSGGATSTPTSSAKPLAAPFTPTGTVSVHESDPDLRRDADTPLTGVGAQEPPHSELARSSSASTAGESRRPGRAASPVRPGRDQLPAASASVIGGKLPRFVEALPVAIAAGAGTTLLMAFLFFGKRRRDEEQPESDVVLAAAAAAGLGPVATATLASIAAAAPLPRAAGTASIDPGEAGMPRWRRPSLMAARKSDPTRHPLLSERLAFDPEVLEATAGMEHARIRYRVVSLLDVPDEFRGTEVEILDEGDEVIILWHSGTYRRVLCPDGVQGWLHKMTLGPLVVASPDDLPPNNASDADGYAADGEYTSDANARWVDEADEVAGRGRAEMRTAGSPWMAGRPD